jgi:ABC-type sugar transport system permease subunit
VLKVFDIVLTMTNGQWNSQVLANLMFDWMFRGGGDFGGRRRSRSSSCSPCCRS